MKKLILWVVLAMIWQPTVWAFDQTPPSNEEYTQDNAASANEVNDTAGWNDGYDGTSESVDSSVTAAYNGSYCLRITSTESNYGEKRYDFDVTGGEEYTITIWAKKGAIGNQQGLAIYVDGNETPTQNVISQTWSDYTFTINPTATGTAYISAKVFSDNGTSSQELFLDSISILKTDTEAPSIPTGLIASTITEDSVTLTWNPSTDNVAVTSYNIYKDDAWVNSTSQTTYMVTGLSTDTQYTFEVNAEDAEANASARSMAITVSTLPITNNATELYTQDNAASVNEVNDTAGWNDGYDGTSESVGSSVTAAHDGSYCLRITSTESNYGEKRYDFDVTGGEEYTITIWAKKGAIGNQQGLAIYVDGNETPTQNVTTQTWSDYTFTINPTATGTAYISAKIFSDNGSTTQELFLDKISITTESSGGGTDPDPDPDPAQASSSLLNFRIKANEPNKIYFDSQEGISSSDVPSGYELKDHENISITGLYVEGGLTTGHYFTVSAPFKWYHNELIKFGDENTLVDFDLQYVQNEIPLPEPSETEYYVTTSGNDANNGLTEATAFRTIQKGVNELVAGGKLWIKAGLYEENVIINNSGTVEKPIYIEGYNENGIITTPYYNYGNLNGNINGSNPFLVEEMPYLYGNVREGVDEDGNPIPLGGNAITFGEDLSFIVIKNIQSENYEKGYVLNSMSSKIIFENVLGKNMGLDFSYGSVFFMDGYLKENNYLKLLNCIAINGTEDNIIIDGHNNLVENCKAYGDRGNTYGEILLPTDYYFLIKGENNIVRNSKATRVSIGHGVHAFSLKYYAMNTLVENCEAINTQWSFQTRYSAVHHNVFKNCEARANVPYRFMNGATIETGGLDVLNGTHHNVYMNMYLHDLDVAFTFTRNIEDDANSDDIAHNNLFKNIIANNLRLAGFQILNWKERNNPNDAIASFNGNKLYNITFNDIKDLFRIGNYSYSNQFRTISMENNEIKNCIFNNIENLNYSYYFNYRDVGEAEFSWENNNFYNSPWATTFVGSNGNIGVDPDFMSTTDFHLQSTSPMIGAGTTLTEVKYDFDGNARPQGADYDIGAFEYVGSAAKSAKEEPIVLGNAFVLYPNPSHGLLTIGLATVESKEAFEIAIFNINGSLVFASAIQNQNKGRTTKTLDLSHLAKGIYILKASSNSKSFTQKILLH